MIAPTKTAEPGKNTTMSVGRGKKQKKRSRINGKPTGLKSLSEAIILQSIEDMWSPEHKKESLEFFISDGFEICSKLAGLGREKQLKIFDLMGGSKK